MITSLWYSSQDRIKLKQVICRFLKNLKGVHLTRGYILSDFPLMLINSTWGKVRPDQVTSQWSHTRVIELCACHAKSSRQGLTNINIPGNNRVPYHIPCCFSITLTSSFNCVQVRHSPSLKYFVECEVRIKFKSWKYHRVAILWFFITIYRLKDPYPWYLR